MEYYWLLPLPGTVKVNVHGATPFVPYLNGNTSGVGIVLRNSDGELLKHSLGILPCSSPLENKLNAILQGLIRAFEDNYAEVVLETDNLDAFQVLKNYPNDVPQEVRKVVRQIFIRLNDPRWICTIVYVYPQRNEVAYYLAKLGGETCKNLYTFTRPVGAVEELLNLDLGFAPMFQDIEIMPEEEDPVYFGPNTLYAAELMYGGYAFQEDYFSYNDPATGIPVVVPIHEVELEDYIFGDGSGGGYIVQGDDH